MSEALRRGFSMEAQLTLELRSIGENLSRAAQQHLTVAGFAC